MLSAIVVVWSCSVSVIWVLCRSALISNLVRVSFLELLKLIPSVCGGTWWFELHMSNTQLLPVVSWSDSADNWATKRGSCLKANKCEDGLGKELYVIKVQFRQLVWILCHGNLRLVKMWQGFYVQEQLILSFDYWRCVTQKVHGSSWNLQPQYMHLSAYCFWFSSDKKKNPLPCSSIVILWLWCCDNCRMGVRNSRAWQQYPCCSHRCLFFGCDIKVGVVQRTCSWS